MPDGEPRPSATLVTLNGASREGAEGPIGCIRSSSSRLTTTAPISPPSTAPKRTTGAARKSTEDRARTQSRVAHGGARHRPKPETPRSTPLPRKRVTAGGIIPCRVRREKYSAVADRQRNEGTGGLLGSPLGSPRPASETPRASRPANSIGGSCPPSFLRSECRKPARPVTAISWSRYRFGGLSATRRDFVERRVVPDTGERSVVGGPPGVRAS